MSERFQERAITGVRVSGVGPLIAASPTTHHDPNLAGIQPVDIHQYAQNPALWASVDPMDPRRAIPPHAPIPPPAMQPSPYAQMVSNRTIGRACEAKLKGVELLYQRLKVLFSSSYRFSFEHLLNIHESNGRLPAGRRIWC